MKLYTVWVKCADGWRAAMSHRSMGYAADTAREYERAGFEVEVDELTSKQHAHALRHGRAS